MIHWPSGTLTPLICGRTAPNTGQFLTSAPNFLYVQAKTRVGPTFADTKKNEGALIERVHFSDLAVGTICGLGSRAYEFALQFTLHPN